MGTRLEFLTAVTAERNADGLTASWFQEAGSATSARPGAVQHRRLIPGLGRGCTVPSVLAAGRMESDSFKMLGTVDSRA